MLMWGDLFNHISLWYAGCKHVVCKQECNILFSLVYVFECVCVYFYYVVVIELLELKELAIYADMAVVKRYENILVKQIYII